MKKHTRPQYNAEELKQLQSAISLHEQGYLAEAIEAYHQLLGKSPHNIDCYRNLGVALAQAGRLQDAIEQHKKAMSLAPRDIDLHFNLIQTHLLANSLKNAISTFRHALRQNDGNAHDLFSRFIGMLQQITHLSVETDDIKEITIQCPPHPNAYNSLARYICHTNLHKSAEVLLHLRDHCIASKFFNALSGHHITKLLRDLKLLDSGDEAFQVWAFDEMVIPFMQRAAALKYCDVVLYIEEYAVTYVKKYEREEHVQRCQAQIDPILCAAGKTLISRNTPRRSPQSPLDPQKVGFFVHRLTSLAHIKTLEALIKGLAQYGSKPISTYIYVLMIDQRNVEVENRLQRLGAQIIFATEPQDDTYSIVKRFLFLQQCMQRDKVSILTWVSVTQIMPLAFSMRIAPIQIWWSLKYHHATCNDIDGYLTCTTGEKFKLIHGRTWRGIHGALHDVFDASTTPRAQELTRQLKNKYGNSVTILGCMGREVKMEDPAYLETVVKILNARPQSIFLWTGKACSTHVQQAFERAAVAERCLFLGWVNTYILAQIIEVYLDTFPFGGGHTVVETMAAGNPVVMRVTPETLESGIPKHILPVLVGDAGDPEEQTRMRAIFTPNEQNLSTCSHSIEEYVEMALRLIDDPTYRSNAGCAGQRYVNEVLSDTRRMAQSFHEHVLDIIAQKQAGNANVFGSS